MTWLTVILFFAGAFILASALNDWLKYRRVVWQTKLELYKSRQETLRLRLLLREQTVRMRALLGVGEGGVE